MMKKENETTIVSIPDLFEMKLTQNDLINYVISKELDRIAVVQEEQRAKKKELEKRLEEIKVEIPMKLTNLGTSKLQKHVDLFSNVTFEARGIENEREMSRRGRFGYFMTPWGPMGREMVMHSVWEDDMRDERRRETRLFSKNILSVIDKDTVLATFRFDLSDEELGLLEKEQKEISNQIEEIRKSLNDLDDQRHAVRSNSEKVRNRLIEQYLDSSEDGKKLLQNLQSIKLTNKQLELKSK